MVNLIVAVDQKYGIARIGVGRPKTAVLGPRAAPGLPAPGGWTKTINLKIKLEEPIREHQDGSSREKAKFKPD